MWPLLAPMRRHLSEALGATALPRARGVANLPGSRIFLRESARAGKCNTGRFASSDVRAGQGQYEFFRNLDDRRTKQFFEDEAREGEDVVGRLNALGTIEILAGRATQVKSLAGKPLEYNVKAGGVEYYSQSLDDGNVQFFRSKDGAEEKLADLEAIEAFVNRENLESRRDYLEFGELRVSSCEEYAALTVRLDPSDEFYSLILQKIATGRMTVVSSTCQSFSWQGNSDKLLFTTVDRFARPHQVWCTSLRDLHQDAQLLLDEKDPTCFLHVGSSKDNSCVIISSNSKTSSEVSIYDLHGLRRFEKRTPGLEYFVEHGNGWFWVVSNYGSRHGDYRIYRVPDDGPLGVENWELVEAIFNEECHVEEMDVVQNHVVAFCRSKATGDHSVFVVDSGMEKPESVRQVSLPVSATTVEPAPGNLDFETSDFTIAYSSPIAAPQASTLDLNQRCLECGELKPVLPNLTTAKLQLGGTPVTLAHVSSLCKSGQHPMLVLCYGAYGHSLTPRFDPVLAALVERGWVLAYVHVRGGSEKGRTWYSSGKLLSKQNSFDDLITAVEILQEKGYARKSTTFGYAASAGGLVMGAVMNRKPGLFRAAALHSPFVSVLSTMTDPELPLTVAEYEEWGNPSDDPTIREFIASYDPVLNIPSSERLGSEGVRFPSLYISCSLRDSRIGHWGPCEYVSRLRSLSNKDASRGPEYLWFQWSTRDGHFGASQEDSRVHEHAEPFAFLESIYEKDQGGGG